MAKRNRRNQARNAARRQQIAERSRQARINEAQRDYSTGRLPKLTFEALGHLTNRQLTQVAGRIADDYQNQQIGLALRDAERFEAQPTVRLTKYERELIRRPDITDAEILAAPAKRRKTMRQQQRRRRAAKKKAKRIQQYNAALMEDYTVGEVREMEMRGESPFEELGGRTVYETSRDYLLRSRANVLADPEFVRRNLRRGDVGRVELINQILTQAGTAGLKAGPTQLFGKTGRTPWNNQWDRTITQLDAFDSSVRRKFESLTQDQKSWLFSNTQFGRLVNNATDYIPGEHKWVLNSLGNSPSTQQQIADWLDEAARK